MDLTEDARLLLTNLMKNGRLPIRSGRLDRRAVCRRLKIVATSPAAARLEPMLAEFEAATAARKEMAPRVRRYLRQADRQGSLPLMRGVINRYAVARHFGFPAFWTRAGDIKAVLDEFDGILRERGHDNSRYDVFVDRVQAFLENGLA
jgi:hypothetical protein